MDVEKDHPAQNTNNHNDRLENGASADSATKNKDATITVSREGPLILAPELKQLVSFRALLEADGHKLQQTGQKYKCCCPFHPDRTPSFFVNDEDTHGKCYGCDWYGDIFKYEMEWHKVEFTKAWLRLNDFLNRCPRAGRKARLSQRKVITVEPEFTPRQLVERKLYADRLATEPWLADLVCQRRYQKTGENWKPEVIRALAVEGSLGWAAGALAFIYPRGTKYRDWPGKDFIWESDGSSLWRGHLLAGAKHIYLTESETDAIALIDGGREHKAGVGVIAMSGVNSFQGEWASLFKDKVVTFCFDNDRAGKDGLNRVGTLLQPYAKQLRTIDMKEVA